MTQEPLSPQTRRFIVLVALLQGLLLWIAEFGHDHQWWPFAELGGRVCWYTLVLGVPGTMTLSAVRLGDRRFWQHAALVCGALVLLAAWAMWSATGAPGLRASEVLGPYGFTTSLALFIALPWLQTRLQHGRWSASYEDLFEHAWQNALTLLLALLFVGICWGVLTLWGELFRLIGIDFFRDLFRERPFVYLATGGMAGLGILIGRTQQQAIRVARRIVLAIFTGLLPLLAAVAVLFALSLPFTGLAPLWKTRSATAILMALVAVIVAFTNAVYQDGARQQSYPGWLRRVVEAGLLSLPVHAALGVYALYLRVDQYGWTIDRYWAALACVILSGYALGYAYAVVRRQPAWLASLRSVNIVLSLVVIVLIAASNSPLLDPHRIAVGDQLARWRDGRTAMDDLDLDYLRFDSGRRGYRAAASLRDDPRVKADAAFATRLAKVLERRTRYDWITPEDRRRNALATTAQLADVITPAPNTGALPADLLAAVLAGDAGVAACRQAGDDCVYIARDLDRDGTEDGLLCNIGESRRVRCELWERRDASWRRAKDFTWSCCDKLDAIKRALRAGEVTPKPRRWPDLEAGGRRASSYDNDE